MKECNNCGYEGLLDHAKKCRCGAVERPSIMLTIFSIMFIVSLITVVEVFTFYFIYYVFFMLNEDVSIMIESNLLICAITVIYIVQCIIYAIINKSFHNDPNTITTTFSKIERREPETTTSSSYVNTSSSNNDDNLLTGIIIGAVAANILSDDDSHHTRSSSTDGYNCSDTFSDGGNDCSCDCGGGD